MPWSPALPSRTGTPRDAWAIDHGAHVLALAAARQAGVTQMVLLSAICVQKPLLAFQHAKLAFEQELIKSGLTYSIVRATAFFKSLSGQLERVKQGKPYLIFGDGQLTACKPISDGDLGRYLAECLDDETRWNRVLARIRRGRRAITRRQREQRLMAARQARAGRFSACLWPCSAPVGGCFGGLGGLAAPLADKAELAGISTTQRQRIHACARSRDGPLRRGCHALDQASRDAVDHYARLLEEKAETDAATTRCFDRLRGSDLAVFILPSRLYARQARRPSSVALQDRPVGRPIGTGLEQEIACAPEFLPDSACWRHGC